MALILQGKSPYTKKKEEGKSIDNEQKERKTIGSVIDSNVDDTNFDEKTTKTMDGAHGFKEKQEEGKINDPVEQDQKCDSSINIEDEEKTDSVIDFNLDDAENTDSDGEQNMDGSHGYRLIFPDSD